MTTAPSSTTSQVRPAFRGDLEGLRAIAVLAVVLYHAGLPWLGGGFIGVDIFFTLSGFLITGVLLQRRKPDGAADLRQFYARRIRRLLPMAVLVLVLTTIVSAIVLPPLRARSVLIDARWTALYAFNLRLAAQGTDYLTATADPSPLQHYWSLGVEEQFYLLWPALLALVLWLARHGSSSTGDADARRLVRWTLGAVAACSFLLSLGWTHSAPPWAFFSLPTRAWQLAVGGLLALGPPATCPTHGVRACGGGDRRRPGRHRRSSRPTAPSRRLRRRRDRHVRRRAVVRTSSPAPHRHVIREPSPDTLVLACDEHRPDDETGAAAHFGHHVQPTD